jgi:selT/selW/selH-like putative selenoprotein
LKETFGIEVELIRGDRGIFDVEADDELIFSKHVEDRFPTDAEVIERLRSRTP